MSYKNNWCDKELDIPNETKHLTNEEINNLVLKTKLGDNKAWMELYENFGIKYIRSRTWKRIKLLGLKCVYTFEKELYSAGWFGFVKALKNYDISQGNFKTYATYYIDGEMSKQIDFEFNSVGLSNKPTKTKIFRAFARWGATAEETKAKIEAFEAMISERNKMNSHPVITVPVPETRFEYTSERRVLQILYLLKLMTDERNSISCEELQQFLSIYRIAKYKNNAPMESANTFNKTMAEILFEMNPHSHTEDNDSCFKIKYDGYETDYLSKRVKMKQDNPNKVETAPVINGLQYVHDFDNDTLDKLIQLVSFSDMFASEDKLEIINKLVSTASLYYKTPFLDGYDFKFNPSGIYGRFTPRRGSDKSKLAENLKTIQYAINNLVQIRFHFNCYNADHEMIPKHERKYILSPYHLVVYHDNYYAIGLNQAWGDKRVLHFRVDLMSDVEILKDNDGNSIPIEVTDFSGLPISNAYWDPEKYMSEHLYMAYDEPRDVRIKIRNTDYTIIHDWFGDHYEKIDEACEDGYDIVKVKTSPFMIVHWALQYGNAVEIMDEDIRNSISMEIRKLEEKYVKKS